VKSINSVSLRL